MANATIIDGKARAAALSREISRKTANLIEREGIRPGLAVVIVGENPASQVYVRNKAKQTRETGMTSFEHRLPVDTAQNELLDLVRNLNDDPAVHGILVQLPLPEQIDDQAVLDAIARTEQQFPGLHIAGNFRDGISVADRIDQAYAFMKKICEDDNGNEPAPEHRHTETRAPAATAAPQ